MNRYAISEKNLPAHELMGLRAEVVKSTDKSRIGLKGKIVDETKNILVLESGGKEKSIPKKEVWVRFFLQEKRVVVDGKILAARPEDRVKFFWRKNK